MSSNAEGVSFIDLVVETLLVINASKYNTLFLFNICFALNFAEHKY